MQNATTFKLNGTTLFVEERGDPRAPAALLLPGGPGASHEYLLPLAERLGDKLHCFVVDPRGTGRSGRPDSMRHADMIADYEALRKELGVDKWILVGHSYGGFISLQYAVDHPESVRGLVLVGTGSAMDMGHLVGKNLQKLSRKYPSAFRAFAEGDFPGNDATDPHEAYGNMMRAAIPLYFKDFDETVAAPVRLCSFSAHGSDQLSHDLHQYDVTDQLRDIKCPTLVIDGKHDFILPVEQQERLHEGIRGSTLMLLETSAHFPFLEDPAGFDGAVRAWLHANVQEASA